MIVAASFWAGLEFQKTRFNDLCLDQGGIDVSAKTPLCIVEQGNDEFWLGPVRVTASAVVAFEEQRDSMGQIEIRLKLKPSIAGALAGFTEHSVGQDLDIQIGAKFVSSVRITEAIRGTEFGMALTEPQASRLAKLLAPRATELKFSQQR